MENTEEPDGIVETDPVDQTPPLGFEPQVEIAGTQPGVYVEPGDLIADAEAERDDDPEVEAEPGHAEDDDEVDSSPDQ